MVEKAGELIIELSADVNEIKSALRSVQQSLKDTGGEAKRAGAGLNLFGSVMEGAVIGTTIAAAQGIMGVTKSLLDLAGNSPEMRIAMADFNEEMRLIGEDIGPEAARVLEGFTDLVRDFWSGGGKEGFTSFLTWINDDLIPVLKTAGEWVDKLKDWWEGDGDEPPGEDDKKPPDEGINWVETIKVIKTSIDETWEGIGHTITGQEGFGDVTKKLLTGGLDNDVQGAIASFFFALKEKLDLLVGDKI